MDILVFSWLPDIAEIQIILLLLLKYYVIKVGKMSFGNFTKINNFTLFNLLEYGSWLEKVSKTVYKSCQKWFTKISELLKLFTSWNLESRY